jgi:hypothetical protein
MTIHRSQTTYAAIRTEGGLLPPDLLDRIPKLDNTLGGLGSEDFGLPAGTRLMTGISEAWQALQTHWASFRRTMAVVLRERGTGTSETRAWVQQVLRELGYRELRFVPATEIVGERSFLISHRAGETDNAPPVHIVSYQQGLEARTTRTGGGEHRSPQALLQGYLNASDHLWGLVTNGLVFRLLRENRQIDRELRIDFDLEGILEAESYAEFQLFWLVLHRSRFVQPGERRESAWLERWSQTAASEGTRALKGLRGGVERAIEALGQGLLAHPQNDYLRQELAMGNLTVDAYYSELLRLVYRLLFLLVAEERQLLFRPPSRTGMNAEQRAALERTIARYRKHYSIERLRQEASRVGNRETHHDDLWRSLLVTFDAMYYPHEASAFGLEPLGGGLFGAGSCPHVADDAAPGTSVDDRITGRPMLANAALLDAISALSEVTRNGVTRRVNYRDLDVEELGSVYEGLLEHRPALEPLANGGYRFGFGTSTSRKETGSYYTPRGLVQELLNSALEPVIEAAMAGASTSEAKERALLDLNICDPACGSGHFLIGAAQRIGRRLAEVRAGADREPELGDKRHATSEAIRHCVYGVDKNPLAVDLCKVALWIESHVPGEPIGFLDHHIRRGDSLIGVFDLQVLREGIPDGAYTPLTGDEKAVATDLKARNRAERSKQTVLGDGRVAAMHNVSIFDTCEQQDLLRAWAARSREIDALPEGSIDDVTAKAEAYERLRGDDNWRSLDVACDLWTYAFFAPLTRESSALVPTSGTVRQMIEQGTVRGDIVGKARGVGSEIGYFHWPLQFPDVFERGGFNCVLGNPPWERVKLQEKEFFESHDAGIAGAPNKAARDRLIRELPKKHPELAADFEAAKRTAENASLFMRSSERYSLTGRGDVNLYSVFAEHFRNLIGPRGRAGVIVPTGIATDDTNKHFFANLVDSASLAALYDFENRKAIFEGVHRSYKFSLLVLAGAARDDARFRAGFFLLDPVEIHEQNKTFLLGADDIRLLNPNTHTCPIFRSERDAALTKAIYSAAPVLVNEAQGEAGNPWGVTFNRMFDMSNDSDLFCTCEELEAQGAELGVDGRFRDNGTEWLPLYEAKLIHQFDHRFATYERAGVTRDVTEAEHADPNFVITPRYWLKRRDVERSAHPLGLAAIVAYRKIARNTDERTLIANVITEGGAGDSICIAAPSNNAQRNAAYLGNLNSVVLDYTTRQKQGGANMSFFIVKQLPVLPPETYTDDLLDLIVPRVLELTYTAHDMAPFARDLGYDGPPFTWDEERRAHLRAELDGIYAHLYGISREDFAYILDTFPIVARKDIAEFGEYRTKRLCLEAWDHFSPETLRQLELEMRQIEQKLRSLIVEALDNDPSHLPSDLREEIMAERARHRLNATADDNPSLRELLESAYMRHLSKIIRSDVAWPSFAGHFGSKSQFEKHLGRLNTFRNPLAHGRSVSEEVRRKGEAAVSWFSDVLAVAR